MLIFTTGLLSFSAGALLTFLYYKIKIGQLDQLGRQILQQAELDANAYKQKNELALSERKFTQERELEQKVHQEKLKLHKEEERLKQREDRLDTLIHQFEKKNSEFEKKENKLGTLLDNVSKKEAHLKELEKKLLETLENSASLNAHEAKELLLKTMEVEIHHEITQLIKKKQEEASHMYEKEAKKYIVTAINRLAASTVSESTVCTVALPSEEIKGRIIGREGRNIRTLEKALGVNFVMDDTPLAVVISSFDPIRRHIAKIALTELVQDGRIHPTKIEEVVAKAEKTIHEQILKWGEDAAYRAGVFNLHKELLILLGKLKLRFSLGQNVLEHSIEVSHLMGLMADELGLNRERAKRIGLLHDVGKAVAQEIPGTHALIGKDLALKYGETPEVANGIGCHHDEIEATTFEGSLCSAADAISASRPGGRVEAVEEYFKRLEKLERLAKETPGVEKAYALQAGREIRVMVSPDLVKEEELIPLARNLTKKIENELSYSGKIRVTVSSEKRVIDYAM